MEEEEAPGGSKMLAGCSRTVQADLTVGSRSGKACQEPRSTNTKDCEKVMIFRMPTVRNEQLPSECDTREQGHQGNYFGDRPKPWTVH